MKKIILNLMDIIIGVIAGYVAYSILSHNASAGDWCVAAICLVLMSVRLFTLIKSAKEHQ